MDRVKRIIHSEHAYKSGLNGKNVTVVIMDTGIAAHPDFDQRILYFEDYYRKKQSLYDDNGHGTHVAGIVGGNGILSKNKNGIRLYSGVAPKVNYVILKVLDHNGNGVTEHVLKAIDWVIKNRDYYHIRILNISVGMLASAGQKEKKSLLDAVDDVWNHGIMVVTAAGNNGPKENSVTIPGISRKVLTVGSWDDNGDGDKTGVLYQGYSGFGPTECCIVKPEILAPGTNIKSCSKDGKGYIVKSGTSMAAPVVTGAIALLLQKYPDLSPSDVKLKIYESVFPRGEQLGRNCWGMLHVDNLVI